MPTSPKSRGFLLALAATAPLAMGLIGALPGCSKKDKAPGDTGAVGALDRVNGSAGAAAVDTTPLKGVDISKLSADQQTKFYHLVDALTSPCGKSQTLRTSFLQDTSCKRAPFAVRFVVELLDDEASEDQARDAYVEKYQTPANDKPVKLDVSKAPHVGAGADAPIRIVEFFDYACPHCQEAKPVFDEVVEKYAGKVSESFLMFPLGRWPDSHLAAQAVYAANAQGRFKEMHTMLFANAPRHSHDNVTAYAKEIGLDPAKFETDLVAAAAQVDADHAQGDGVGVESTPTVYINDKKYSGPMLGRYLELWIDEELAVNR